MRKASIIITLTALLVACGSIYEQSPVGMGTDVADLKKSPCACVKIQLEPGLPEWLMG